MALTIDTQRALRTVPQHQSLVDAIRGAPSHEQETDWVEWKVGVDLREKAWQAEIGRQTLGFANRHPDRAASVCGGCAYLVLGVEPGNLEGVNPVDAAALDDSVSAYVATDGPQWAPDYVRLDGKTVLVITIEPPRWGDRIFAFEKEFPGFKNGDVFIRRHGKTEHANAQELRMLSERAAARGDRLMVDLDWWEEPGQAVAIDVSEEAVEAWVASEKRALLADTALGFGRRASSRIAAELVETRDRQSHERDVEKYLAAARPLVRDLWKRRAVQNGLGKLKFAVVNLTEHNFTDVRVVMEFDGNVWSAFQPSDIEMPSFPERPKPWAALEASPLANSILRDLLTPTARVSVPQLLGRAPERRGWSDNSGSTTLRFASVDVRPGYRHHIGPVYLVASAEYAGQEVEGSWHATCRSTSGMASGVFAVAVADVRA